jgi:HD-GYP domain-containing protein (c-di-GMP phosphodiesterase class II)
VHLAELIAALSLATDLGLGVPQEHVLRQTVIATRLAELAGMDTDAQAAVFYTSLFAWVGCVADSHELAKWFGDDRKLRVDSYRVDKAGLPMMRFMLAHVAPDAPALRRISVIGRFMVAGARETMAGFNAHCQTTSDITDRLGLPDPVRRGLPQVFERWDGKGAPEGLKGEQILRTVRVVQIADDVEMAHRDGGIEAAVELVRTRSGTEFDPALAQVVATRAEELFDGLDQIDAWATVIDGCAGLDRRLADQEITGVLEIFGDYADLKSPYFIGHSRATAALVSTAATELGIAAATRNTLARAALVARIGVTGVSTGIWDKPSRLTAIELERVRTAPYLTERVLSRQPALAKVSALAGMRCERMDGSGYPRGLSGAAIPLAARVLAAADVYQALSEHRAHRPALNKADREQAMLAEVTAGRLDDQAVRAVLVAAGHRARTRATRPAGLTEREVEVLNLLARGKSNKEMAKQLSISAKTVGSHVEHIYTKIGASTRGAAAMYAARHDLVDPDAD